MGEAGDRLEQGALELRGGQLSFAVGLGLRWVAGRWKKG